MVPNIVHTCRIVLILKVQTGMEHVPVCTLQVVFSYLGFKCHSKSCLLFRGKISTLRNTCTGIAGTDKRSLHGIHHGQSLQLTQNATYFTSRLFYAHKVIFFLREFKYTRARNNYFIMFCILLQL